MKTNFQITPFVEEFFLAVSWFSSSSEMFDGDELCSSSDLFVSLSDLLFEASVAESLSLVSSIVDFFRFDGTSDCFFRTYKVLHKKSLIKFTMQINICLFYEKVSTSFWNQSHIQSCRKHQSWHGCIICEINPGKIPAKMLDFSLNPCYLRGVQGDFF